MEKHMMLLYHLIIVDLSNIIFDDSYNLLDSYQIEIIEDPRPQLYYSYRLIYKQKYM